MKLVTRRTLDVTPALGKAMPGTASDGLRRPGWAAGMLGSGGADFLT